MLIVKKNITLDGYEYQVEFKPEPIRLAPYGFSLIVYFEGKVILKNKYNNYDQKPYKEAIEEILKYHHEKFVEKINRKQTNNAFLAELEKWDGVIQ